MPSNLLRNFTVTLGVLALVVRGWALIDRSPELGPGWLPVAAAAMGLVYLAAGFVVLRLSADASATLLALHCFAQATHWGGPPELAGTPRLAAWLTYYAITVLGEAAFVDYVVTFPARARRLARPLSTILYAPAALLAGATLVILLLPEEATTRELLLTGFFTVEMAAANGLAAVGLLLLVVRARRHAPDAPLGRALRTMVRVAAIGYLPYALAALTEWRVPGSVPVGTQPFTLFFAVVPIGFAYALLRLRAAASSGGDRADAG